MCYACRGTIQERVQNGIRFLDEFGPKDWRSRINLETLDVGSCTLCVLGQVFADKVGTKYITHECDDEDCLSVYGDGFEYGADLVYKKSENNSGELGFAGSAVELTAEWKRVLSETV